MNVTNEEILIKEDKTDLKVSSHCLQNSKDLAWLHFQLAPTKLATQWKQRNIRLAEKKGNVLSYIILK